MRLETTVKTIITKKEWDILIAAKVTLTQLYSLLQDYEYEADVIGNAIDSLKIVTDDIIDEFE